MTTETLTPIKGLGKKKIGEIYRLQKFMEENQLKPVDIHDKTGISERTITHSLYDEKPLGAKLLRELHVNYGVSIDWLVSGVGPMMLHDNSSVKEQPAADYYGMPLRTSTESINRTARDQRLLGFISEWLTYANDDEKAWLEMELKFNLVQYQRYLEDLENDN